MIGPFDAATLVWCSAAAFGLMAIMWVISLPLRDVSIVDLVWGPGFAMIGWIALALAEERGPRSWLLAGLTTVWAARLAGYLAWRNLGHGEDKRYAAMRRARGASFWWRSLGIVFGLQAALMLVVSVPLQIGMRFPEPASWVAVVAGVSAWVLGLVFESVGDWQLARFKGDPANRGAVMDRGLWRYTRHPNYFGDFMVWWGLFLVAVPSAAYIWIAIGPALMTLLLVRVSGVGLLEKDLGRRPGYADYIRRTSAFIPRPPRV